MSLRPVAQLNELIMLSTQTQPHYEVIEIVAGTHENKFKTRVSCPVKKNGPLLEAIGEGPSKKDSKSEAALNFMKKYLPLANSTRSNNTTNTNINTLLQNFCAKKKLDQPCFEEGNTTGPPHSRHFKYKCRVAEFVTKGEGGTKSEAKSNAATKMLKMLTEETEVSEVFESQKLMVATKPKEVICLPDNLKSSQLTTQMGHLARRASSGSMSSGSTSSSSLSSYSMSSISMSSSSSRHEISVVQIPLASSSTDTSTLIIEVINPFPKIDEIKERSNNVPLNMNLIDLSDNSTPEPRPNKHKSKSWENLSASFKGEKPKLSSLDKMNDKLDVLKVANEIEATLKDVEKQLYDQIRKYLGTEHSTRRKSVIILSHKFDVHIDYDSKPKICEGNTVCNDASIRIAVLSKLLMEMKKHATVAINEKSN